MIFEENIDQIKALESHQLVNLMRRLILAECRLTGIPLRNATVPLQITVADGGEDGNVEWEAGVDCTDFFPSRCSIFQSKAQNLTESTVRNEIVNSSSRLNNAISEAIRKQGAYIIFSSHAFTGAKIKKLKNAITSMIKEHGENPDSATIEIYDANKIASWVNTHHSIALWLASLQRGRSVYGFQSHEAWGKAPEIAKIHWVSGNDLRFSCKNEAVSQKERIDKNFNGWNFKGVVEKCYSHLDNEQNILRVSGPSGFGKTRFVFELFKGLA